MPKAAHWNSCVSRGGGALTKPATADVNTGPAAEVKSGLKDVMDGLATVIEAVPGLATRLAGTAAVSRVALTKLVGRAAPFQSTTAPEANPVPFTVRVNATPVVVVEAGCKDVIDGPSTLPAESYVKLVEFPLASIGASQFPAKSRIY